MQRKTKVAPTFPAVTYDYNKQLHSHTTPQVVTAHTHIHTHTSTPVSQVNKKGGENPCRERTKEQKKAEGGAAPHCFGGVSFGPHASSPSFSPSLSRPTQSLHRGKAEMQVCVCVTICVCVWVTCRRLVCTCRCCCTPSCYHLRRFSEWTPAAASGST
jgi:hypothetical protein